MRNWKGITQRVLGKNIHFYNANAAWISEVGTSIKIQSNSVQSQIDLFAEETD